MHIGKSELVGIGILLGGGLAASAEAALQVEAWANVNRFYRQTSSGVVYDGTRARAVIKTSGTTTVSGNWSVTTPVGGLPLSSVSGDGTETFTNALMNDPTGNVYVGNWSATALVGGPSAGPANFWWSYTTGLAPSNRLALNAASVSLLDNIAINGGSGMVPIYVQGNTYTGCSWALQRFNSDGTSTVVAGATLNSSMFMLDASLITSGSGYALTLSKFGDSTQYSTWGGSAGVTVTPYAGTTNITVFNFGNPVPAPGAFALLAAAGLSARRRRR